MTAVASCLHHPHLSLLPGIWLAQCILHPETQDFDTKTFLDFSHSRLLSVHAEQDNNDNDSDNDNVLTHLHNTSRERHPPVGPAALIGFEKWYVVIQQQALRQPLSTITLPLTSAQLGRHRGGDTLQSTCQHRPHLLSVLQKVMIKKGRWLEAGAQKGRSKEGRKKQIKVW